MDPSTLLYLAAFFFILGAGIVGVTWVVYAWVRSTRNKGGGSSSQDPNLSVMALLLRDLRTQDLVVEMEGKTFRAVSELSPAQLKKLGIIANVLTKWLNLPKSAAAQPSADQPTSAPSTESAAPVIPAVSSDPTVQPAAAAAAFSMVKTEPSGSNQLPSFNDWIPAESVPPGSPDHHVPPFTAESTSEVKPVSTQLTDVVGGILNPAPAPASAYKSIAMQINDILQERITGTSFEKRGITVSDGPDHGVQVTLDGQKYPGVKDIPDEEVRSLIRSAVHEWEKQGKHSTK